MFEINLVPDVKNEMLKAQRIRNIVLFVCIMIIAACVTIVLAMLGIKGGQDIAMTVQDNELKAMSSKIHDFNNLDEYITIQDQLGKLSSISNDKKAASRLFGILTAIQPTADEITYSELKLDLEKNTLSFEGQANAGPGTDGIDYRALESFRKGIERTTYDHGNYVDKEGAEIPAYCIEEFDSNGNALKEDNNNYFDQNNAKITISYYANWYPNRSQECNPSAQKFSDTSKDYSVKIWRTPQFKEWFDKKYFNDNNQISGIEHFESQCINYDKSDDGKKWIAKNDTCKLSEEGLQISESSNGLDDNDSLVLRFTGLMILDSNILTLVNRHMQFVGPTGQNVTDSYTQVKDMFEKRAHDCDKNDKNCQNQNSQNGGNNG